MVGGLVHINEFNCIDLFLTWFVKDESRPNINGLCGWVDGSIRHFFIKRIASEK